MTSPNFLIVGAGIFGLSTAYKLSKQSYKVAVLNPGTIPHPHAASTDISKVIRFKHGLNIESWVYLFYRLVCCGLSRYTIG